MIKPPLSVTLSIQDDDLLENIKRYYACFLKDAPSQYITFFAKAPNTTISVYAPKKGITKVLFQGSNALNEAKKWDADANINQIKAKKRKIDVFLSKYPQIGSDEVGTGDFFGPICVAAAYVKKEDLEFLKELGVTDSKLLSDEKILEIGPLLIAKFDYSQIALSNEKYNEVHDQNNMNAIKAKMHNACLLKMIKRHPEAWRYQDQFAEEKLYYHYLSEEKEIVKGIIFKTEGELAYPSVALASVIARYSFLLKMDALNKKYGLIFPLGASKQVDLFATEFINKYGEKELNAVAKMNFANAKRLGR